MPIIIETDGTAEGTKIYESRTKRDMSAALEKAELDGVKLKILLRAGIAANIETIKVVPTGALKEARINTFKRRELESFDKSDLPALKTRYDELRQIVADIIAASADGDMSDEDREYVETYQNYKTLIKMIEEGGTVDVQPSDTNTAKR